jgi:hypothetical protein
MESKNVEFNKDYWNSFYQNFQSHIPSQFCVSVVTDLKESDVLVELGSGNGRDAHYFASQGVISVAMDLSLQAIDSCTSFAKDNGIDHSIFIQGDLTDASAIKGLVALAREKSSTGCVVFYSRFVMHSLDDSQEQNLLDALSQSIIPGDKCYFEFRSKEDANLDKHFGGHFRRYVDTPVFEESLRTILGVEIDYSITGQGMARFREEDPFVSRVIATKGG